MGRQLVAMALTGLLLLLASHVQATHLAFGTIQWTRSTVAGQVYNPSKCVTNTFTTANTNAWQGCWWTITFIFAMRSSYYTNVNYPTNPTFSTPPVVPTATKVGSSNFIGLLRAYHQTTIATGNPSNYLNMTGIYVTPVTINTANDWFLGQKIQNFQLFPGNSVLSYQVCCRLSTLQNGNANLPANVNVYLVASEIASLQTTGLAREYFVFDYPIDYVVPVVHQNSNYSFSFTLTQTACTTPYPSCLFNNSGLNVGAPYTTTGGTRTLTLATTDSDEARALGTSDNGRLIWTPKQPPSGSFPFLYSVSIRIAAGIRPPGCNWYDTSLACAFVEKSWSVLDFIMSVGTVCLPAQTNCNHPPFFTDCNPNCNHVVPAYTKFFYPGIEGSMTIIAADQDVGQTVSLVYSVLPAGSTLTQVSQPSTIPVVAYQFVWTPLLDSVSAVVCFKAQDSLVAFSLGNWCLSLKIGVASLIYVSGIIRDFNKTNTFVGRVNNPDFGVACATANTNGCDTTVPQQFVSYELGADNTPTYNRTGAITTVSSESTFNAWFHDTPAQNSRLIYSLTLSNGTVADGRIFTYFTSAFYAADALASSDGGAHNNYFTYELHAYVSYTGGEVFEFGSSDDMWVFINRKLPTNWTLHGIHNFKTFYLSMDYWANRTWNLALGGIYPCDIFFAHRSTAHAPALQLQLPNAVLCDSLSTGVLTVNFSPNFATSYPVTPATSPATYTAQQHLLTIGDACWGGACTPAYPGVLVLTKETSSSVSGVAYYSEQQTINGNLVYAPLQLKVLQGFSTTFTFQYGTSIGGCAGCNTKPHGFAFLIQSSSSSAQGNDGNQLGYGGIPRSLAVEFDSNTDQSLNDPGYGHVSCHTKYILANEANEKEASIGISSQTPAMTFENGTAHTVTIQYQPGQADGTTNVKGWIRVWMNQNIAPVMQAQVSMSELANALGGAAWAGFSAGQGNGVRARISILSWTMTIVGVAPGSCVVIPPPGSVDINSPTFQMIAGRAEADTWLASGGYGATVPSYVAPGYIGAGVIIVQTKDSCGNLITVGNDPAQFTVVLRRRVGSAITLNYMNGIANGVTVTSNQQGTYSIQFNPTEIGLYDIDVKYAGIPISGSPFLLTVAADVADVSQSYFSFSPARGLLVQPNNAPLYNGQLSAGLFMVTVSPTTGLVLSQTLYDFVNTVDSYGTGGPAAFVSTVASLPVGTIVGLACVSDCFPRLTNAVQSAVLSLGGTGVLAGLRSGGSYALLGVKGGSAVGEDVQNSRATATISRLFPSAGVDGVTISVQSCGLNFGLTMDATAGGYGRITVDPTTAFLTANTEYSFAAVLRDKWGNPAVSQNSESLVLSLNPDITLSSGVISPATPTFPGFFNFSFLTAGNKQAGSYNVYVKMSSTAGTYSPLSATNVNWPTYAPVNIFNSPRTVYVVADRASPEMSTASGSGLTASAVSQQQNCFQVNLLDEFLNQATNVNPFTPDVVTVSLVGVAPLNLTLSLPTAPGSSMGWVKCTGSSCVPCPSSTDVCVYQVCYTGVIAGTYDVKIKVNGQPMTSSAGTTITVVPGTVYARNSQLIPPSANSVQSGMVSYLGVQAYDAANNMVLQRNMRDFTVVMTQNGVDVTSQLQVSVIYNGGGSYTIQFVPVLAGTLVVSAYNPVEPGVLVSGGTLSLVVTPGVPSANSYLSNLTSSGPVNSVQTITVTGVDAAGNLVSAGNGGAYLAQVRLAQGTQLQPSSVGVAMQGPTPAQTVFQWTSLQSGAFSVSMQIATSGEVVGNAPQTVTLTPLLPLAANFAVQGDGRYGGIGNTDASFTIQAVDIYGNNATQTNLVFTFTHEGDAGASVVYTAADPVARYGYKNIGPGLYQFTYKVPDSPATEGQFDMSVVYPVNANNPGNAESHIVWQTVAANGGSTFRCFARPGDLSVVPGDATASANPNFSGGWNVSYVGIATEFYVVDYTDRTRTEGKLDSMAFAVNMYHVATGITVNNIVVSTGNLGQQAFKVTYTPAQLGPHVMNITRLTPGSPAVVCGAGTYNDGTPTPAPVDPVWAENYGFFIDVRPGLISSFRTRVIGLNQADIHVVGTFYTFQIEPADQYGNVITNSTYVFTAVIDHANVYQAVYNATDSLYYVTYTAQLASYKSVRVSEATLAPGALMGNQAYSVNFVAAEPDATHTDCSFL